jgi:hypothetical protein
MPEIQILEQNGLFLISVVVLLSLIITNAAIN